MPRLPLAAALRRLRPPDDAALLARHLGGDPAAFTALVRRHGPMVLGVCRRVLPVEADAEDAFQATFLLLARKAAGVRQPARVGNWLYGVARNVARRARAAEARRRRWERAAAVPVAAFDRPAESVVDDELHRLPDRYRLPIVCCGLDGMTMKEAAAALGWPAGTVATRLNRGRALLADRLARRGVVVPAVLTGVVSETLITRTVAAGPAPAAVLSLATEVTRAMFFAKLKAVTAVLAVAGVGAGLVFGQPPKPAADKPAAAAMEPMPEAIRAEVVMVQAGRPHRLRLPGSPPRVGSLRVADEELLTVAHSPDDPAALVLTGQKPGTCFLAGQRADGTELGVLVVISRPYLRLSPTVGEVLTLTLPGGRRPAEMIRTDIPPGLQVRIFGGGGFELDNPDEPRRIRLAEDGSHVIRLYAISKGVYPLRIVDDRGLEWRVEVVYRGAAKP